MASGFPGSIDSFTNPLSSSALNSPSHSGQHSDLNDAVNKIETYMGLVLIKTGTVTNAADSGTVFRSIFNSTYTSYRIVCHTLNAHTNGAQPRVSLLYSTSTEQTTGYYSAMNMAAAGGTSAITAVNNGAYVALMAACDNISGSSFSMDVHQVGATSVRGPNFLIQAQDNYTGAFGSGGALNINARAFDGLRFVMSTGNISMTASVYGYRK